MANVIKGTAGNDQIENSLSGVKIYGFEGNDSIVNDYEFEFEYDKNGRTIGDGKPVGAKNVTIFAGAGDDKIYNRGMNVSIDADTGNDLITNGFVLFDKKNYGYTNYVTMSGGKGNDTIENSGDNVKIFGGADKDSIRNGGSFVVITGNEGNDSIYNFGSNVTVSGDAGKDYIRNEGSKVSINGGDGDDNIKTSDCSSVTINAGKDNDIIAFGNYSKSNLIQYTTGDGNDTIYGVRSDTTIQIATNSGYISKESGNDLIIKVGNGKMILKNGANKSFNIVTEELSEEEDFRLTSASALNNFIAIGKGTDTKPSYTSKDSEINKLPRKFPKAPFTSCDLLAKYSARKQSISWTPTAIPNSIGTEISLKTIHRTGR